jgi:hypothetical protein
MANLNQNLQGADDNASSLYETLRGITSELKGQETEISKSRKAFRDFEKIAQDVKLQQEGISQLTDKQVQDYSKLLAKQISIAEQEAERLVNSTDIGALLVEEVNNLRQAGVEQSIINDLVNSNLSVLNDLTEEQKALISAYFDEYSVIQDINGEVDKELEVRKEINRLLGVSGNILKGINELLGPFAKAFNLDAVSEAMAETADAIARGDQAGNRLTVALSGAQAAGKALVETLSDPAVVVGKIVDVFNDFEKANREVRQLTGQTASNFSDANTFATTLVDQAATIATLSEEIGINVNAAFSPDTILAASELTQLMGVSAQSSAKLAMTAEAFGKDLGKVDTLAVNTVQSFAAQGKGALNVKQVLEGAGNASQTLQLSFKGNNEELLKASANAAALGLTLENVERIADSLLDFESSIAAELEAELLTGKNINLEKARTAALNNDMATLTEEIANNQEILSAFSSGNRIQQDAIAKSLGMSKDEVAKMIVLQKIKEGMDSKAIADAMNINEEEVKRLSTQESLNKAMEGLADAFTPLLDYLAKLLSSEGGMITFQALIATIVGGKAILGIANMAGSFKSLAGSMGILSKASQAAGPAIQGATTAANAANVGSRVPPTAGRGIRGFFTGLGQGLKVFANAMAAPTPLGPVGLIAAAALGAITISIIGLGYALKLAAPGIEAFGTVVTAVFKTMTLEKALMLPIIGLGLMALAGGAITLGLATPLLLVASVGLLALGMAMIPLSIGFEKMAETNTEGLINSLIQFASMAPALALVAASLFGIAGGLAAVSLAGFAALPVIGALTGLGLVAGVINPGGGGDEVVKELKEVKSILVQILNKDSNISIDSTRLGTAMSISSARLQ